MEQPSLNTSFGSYVPIRFLAHWTLGERFLARKENASPGDPPVVVDRLWLELTRFEGFLDELDKIEKWRKVAHPSLAHVLEVGYEGDQPFVVSEFFEGRSLEALIHRRETAGEAIPLKVVLEMGSQLAQGLAALHEAKDGFRPLGLIHGSLAPTRILLDSKVRVKVLGGWSSRLEGRLPWAVPPRTVVYQSPEEIWGRPSVDRRTDLYSLGVVLYEALVGRFCPAEEPLSFLRRVLRRDADEAAGLEQLPPPVRGLLKRLLAQDPTARPADARHVADELKAMLEALGARTPAPAPEPVKPAPEPVRVAPEPPKAPPMAAAQAAGLVEPAPVKATEKIVVTPKPVFNEPSVPNDMPAEPDISLRVTTVVTPVSRQKAMEALQGGQEAAPGSLWFNEPPAQPVMPSTPLPPPPVAAPVVEPRPESLFRAPPVPEPPAPVAPPPVVESRPESLFHAPAPVFEPPAPVPPPPVVESRPESLFRAPPVPEPPAPVIPEPPAPVIPPPAPVVEDVRPVAAPVPPPVPEPEPEVPEEEESGPLALQEPLEGLPRGFLVYREGSSKELRYPLAGDVVTLGRSSQNTYQILSEIKASRFHCELQWEATGPNRGRWLLSDKKSTNGTYVNGQPITLVELKGREKVNIGFTTFRFVLADEKGLPISVVKDRTDKSVEIPKKKRKRQLRASLIRNYGTPQETHLELTGDVYLIGRAQGNSLQLNDPQVAPSHCEIRYQDGVYIVEDHQSEHGTLVNGFLVDTLALEGGEEITVGNETFKFSIS